MTQITRKWSEARAKCDAEGCRVCGTSRNVEAAHIIGTALDRFDLDGTPHPTKTWPVYAIRIVPLCGPFPEGCHGDYDHKRLSIEPYLTKQEAAQARSTTSGRSTCAARAGAVVRKRRFAARWITPRLSPISTADKP